MTPEQRMVALTIMMGVIFGFYFTVMDVVKTRKKRAAQFFLRLDRQSTLKFLNGNMAEYGVQVFTDDRFIEQVRVIPREWKPWE